jgi:hypothetical protein
MGNGGALLDGVLREPAREGRGQDSAPGWQGVAHGMATAQRRLAVLVVGEDNGGSGPNGRQQWCGGTAPVRRCWCSASRS